MTYRLRALADIYPDEIGFMDSLLVSPEQKLARIRQMCREQDRASRPKPPRKYKGSKAAKRASRRAKPHG